MDELRSLNKTNLKNMAIEKGLSRKGFNGRNISRMRKQDFIDFIESCSNSDLVPNGARVQVDSSDHSLVDYRNYEDSEFEEEMLDFFGEIILNGPFQPIIHILGLGNRSDNDSRSAKEAPTRVPKEEDELVPCLCLKAQGAGKPCNEANCTCETCQVEKENAKVRSNIQELENKVTCVICQSNERKVLFSPCNHLATCIACSKNALLKNCPLCRTEFNKLTRVFY